MMFPCDGCGVELELDVYREELGMCLDCSNRFWSHNEDGHECSWQCVSMAAMPKEVG